MLIKCCLLISGVDMCVCVGWEGREDLELIESGLNNSPIIMLEIWSKNQLGRHNPTTPQADVLKRSTSVFVSLAFNKMYENLMSEIGLMQKCFFWTRYAQSKNLMMSEKNEEGFVIGPLHHIMRTASSGQYFLSTHYLTILKSHAALKPAACGRDSY